MDIWDWVQDVVWDLYDEGQERLANLVAEMPSAVVDMRPEDVHAISTEALGLLDKNKYPWLEIYFRHWRLQYEVLNQMNARDYMQEAIELLEVAHQPQNKNCPQSICVVQDITNCYGLKDGLGYVEERLAITQEGLEKIDFSWACFNCIGSEYLDTLIDAGRADEALVQIKQWKAESLTAPNASMSGDELFQRTMIRCYIALEQYEDAILIGKNAKSVGGGERFVQETRLLLANAYLGNGQIEEALEQSVSFEIVAKTPDDYILWMNFWHKLAMNQTKYNTNELNDKFEQFISVLENKGIQRISLNARKQQAQLAVSRKDSVTLSHAIEKYAKLTSQLDRDCGATEELQALRQLVC